MSLPPTIGGTCLGGWGEEAPSTASIVLLAVVVEPDGEELTVGCAELDVDLAAEA